MTLRRFAALLAAIGLSAGLAAPAFAQDILGLSVRPAPGHKELAGTGSVDITRGATAGKYTIKLDMAGAAESLDLTKHEGATAWVVWAVDMDGNRHTLGALDEKLALAGKEIDFVVAKLYITAEKDAAATTPGEPLYQSTLRQVTEKEGAAVGSAGASSAAAPATAAPAATATGAAPAAGSPTAAAAAKADAKPANLPTTGAATPDLWLLALVAMVLMGLGLRLERSRA